MQWDVVLAAVLSGLAIYTMEWGFSFGGRGIRLPKEQTELWFFDKIHAKRPNFFRFASSISAAFGILFFGHGLSLWIVIAAVFALTFSCYFFICSRSYYWNIRDPDWPA